MPALLEHVLFAKEVYRILQTTGICIDETEFIAGNLIPDLAIDHKNSHYHKPASINGLFTPNMNQVRQKLYDVNKPINFGMYAHLFLDNKFIDGFIIPGFIWDAVNIKIINPNNNMEWDPETFFSDKGMYGSYTEIDTLLIKNGIVAMSDIEEIPEILPKTGIPVFDSRRAQTWKQELNSYIAQNKPYTGNIFKYENVLAFLKNTVHEFIDELNMYLSNLSEKVI